MCRHTQSQLTPLLPLTPLSYALTFQEPETVSALRLCPPAGYCQTNVDCLLDVLALIPLVQGLDGDAAQQLARENAQQRPCEIQGVEDGAVLQVA